MKGVYLYAIVEGESRLDLGRIGLPDGQTPVSILPFDGLSAVTGNYRGPAFSQIPKPELLRCLTIHQRVIESVMAHRPVLPAKFATVLPNQDSLRKTVGDHHDQLTQTLQQFGDTVEIEVAATWDLPRTFAEIGRQPEIASLAATIGGRPAAETLTARVEIGRLVKESLDRRRSEYQQSVIRDLGSIARGVQPNALPSDELVLNVAFLVDRARLDDFDAEVHRLDAGFGGQLTFRCVGPLPPYSFTVVEIIPLSGEQIEAARRQLGLDGDVSEAEVNAKYRRLAMDSHPDRHPGDPTAAARFADLASARALLLAYLRDQTERTNGASHPDCETGSGTRRPALAPEAIRERLVLRIKRPERELVGAREAE